MRERLLKKLRGKAGESIGETLVALLVSTMALMLLAGMITASTRLVLQSKERFDVYYHANNVVAAQKHETSTPKATLTIRLAPGESAGVTIPEKKVYCYINKTLGRTPVISYSLSAP